VLNELIVETMTREAARGKCPSVLVLKHVLAPSGVPICCQGKAGHLGQHNADQ